MIIIKSKNQDSPEFPIFGYVGGYTISKFFDAFKSFSYFLDRFETRMLNNDKVKMDIKRPIYITGLARAGTTIVLEMLHQHPDLASHQYKHFLMPYTPYWIGKVLRKNFKFAPPIQRLHKDGIFVTYDSPEAIEEIFWQDFFKGCHNENISNIISANDNHQEFEKFYLNHIRKLILCRKTFRYLAKNNYNITRLEYLLRLFPNSKFLIMIRNPVDQIASLIKQTKLFMDLERRNPFLKDWLRIIGHHEFGHNQVCINIGNTDLISRIRTLWSSAATYVKGWAYYWNSIYEFVANLLEVNKKIQKATLVVKFEELCENPKKIIDQILAHTELENGVFDEIKQYYIKHIHKPSYYTYNFSSQELADISNVTKKTVARFELKIPIDL